jgi:hypothetical protein
MSPLCDKCDDRGFYLVDPHHSSLGRFCDCSKGRQAERDFVNWNNKLAKEWKRGLKREAKMVRDGKAEAAGERQPREDDNVPF